MSRIYMLCVAAVLTAASEANAQRFSEVAITGSDYAFLSVAPTLTAGPTVFSFENKGKVRHEMILVRLRPGVTVDSATRARQAGAPPQTVGEIPGGILLAEPGQQSTGRLLVELSTGRTYLLVCNFRDAPDKPPHTALGMVASFQVK